MDWISCRNWRTFQHYDPAKRQPPWIKVYNELLDSDDYGGLTLRQRGILHGVWMAYARSGCGLRVSRVGLMIGDETVKRRDIDSLVHAGFLDIVASKVLAEGYQGASASRARVEVETEVEEEVEVKPRSKPPTTNPALDVAADEKSKLQLVEAIAAGQATVLKDLSVL